MDVTSDNLCEYYVHKTGLIPYSLHHTIVSVFSNTALYLHWHNEIEIFFLECGKLNFYIENTCYELNEGEAIMISPHMLHKALRVDKNYCSFYAIVFSPQLISNSFTYMEKIDYTNPFLYSSPLSITVFSPKVKWQAEILDYLKKIYSFYSNDTQNYSLELCGLMMVIWQKLYNEHLSKIATGEADYLAAQLRLVINYIHLNFKEELSLESLAQEAHISKGYLCRTFKVLTGFTPFEYLNRYRIQQSCNYLTYTNKKVTEVAAICGFNNISYFNRTFFKYMGETPSNYRKNRNLETVKNG